MADMLRSLCPGQTETIIVRGNKGQNRCKWRRCILVQGDAAAKGVGNSAG